MSLPILSGYNPYKEQGLLLKLASKKMGQKGGAMFMGTKKRRTRRRRRGRRQRGKGLLLSLLGKSAGLGYKLGKSKKYRRMGAIGVNGGVHNYRRKPWEV